MRATGTGGVTPEIGSVGLLGTARLMPSVSTEVMIGHVHFSYRGYGRAALATLASPTRCLVGLVQFPDADSGHVVAMARVLQTKEPPQLPWPASLKASESSKFGQSKTSTCF